MRFGIIFLMTILIVTSPTVGAHESINHIIEIKDSSIQPSEISVLENDTLSFYNIANQSRTISIDNIWKCDVGPYNSTTQDDECHLWLDSSTWNYTNLSITISQNDSLRMEINVIILDDNHTDFALPEDGFELSGGIRDNSSSDDLDIGDFMLGGALVSFGIAALLWIRNRGED